MAEHNGSGSMVGSFNGQTVSLGMFNGKKVFGSSAPETFTLSGSVTDNVSNASVTSSYSVSGEDNDTGSFNISVVPFGAYQFTSCSGLSVSGLGGNLSAGSFSKSGNNCVVPISYTIPGSNTTDNISVSGSASLKPTVFTVNFIDNTGDNCSFNTSVSSHSAAPGSTFSGSRNVTYSPNFKTNQTQAFTSNNALNVSPSNLSNTATVSWSGVMPFGGGSATVIVQGSAVTSLTTFTYGMAGVTGFAVSSGGAITAPTASSGTISSITYLNSNNNLSYDKVGASTTRTANVSVTVPPGFTNSGGTVSGSITAIQQFSCIFALLPSTLLLGNGNSGTTSVAVSGGTYHTNTNVADWLTINSTGNTLILSYEVNNSGALRSTIFVVSATNGCTVQYHVAQPAAVADSVNITQSVSNFTNAGGSNTLNIQAAGNSNTVITDTASWLTSTYNGGSTITISATANTGAQRTATLTATKGAASDTVTITQAGASGGNCTRYVWTSTGGFGVGTYTTCDGTVVSTTIPNNFIVCAQTGSVDVITGGSWTAIGACI